jgi:hypothetical protein
MFIHIYIFSNENTFTYIYTCRCIVYVYIIEGEKGISVLHLLYLNGELECICIVCVYAHTHTLHVGLSNSSPGVGTRHTKSSHTKSSKKPDRMNLGSTCIRNTQINISLVPKKQRKKSEGDIETSNPAGFDQIDPTGRVLDYLGK